MQYIIWKSEHCWTNECNFRKIVIPGLQKRTSLKNPTKCLWRWEPDRRSNFFFSPTAHLCAVTYMTEISLIVTLNNQFSSPHLALNFEHPSELLFYFALPSLCLFKVRYTRTRFFKSNQIPRIFMNFSTNKIKAIDKLSTWKSSNDFNLWSAGNIIILINQIHSQYYIC